MHKVARLALLAALVLFGGFTAGAQTPRVLIVATSHSQALGGRVTGLWLSELTEPYWVFRDAGLEVDITTIKGGSPPIDPRSGSEASVSGALRNDSRALAAFRQAPPLDSVGGDAYDAVFLAGGHGTMWDFPAHRSLAALVSAAFRAGKPVAAVCHGPAGFLGATDADGRPIVAGRRVTAFANDEERAAGWTAAVPYLLEDRLRSQGARFADGGVYRNHAVRDGNLITGQNPMSAAAAARLVLEALREMGRMP